MPTTLSDLEGSVAAGTHLESLPGGHLVFGVLWIVHDSGTIIFASHTKVLRTVAVDACFEATEVAGEDTAVPLAVVTLESVISTPCAAILAEAASVA